MIFPEGGNFTERRRAAGIARLRARGLEEAARRSEAMRHVLPPQPGGVAAALAAAPEADVVWVAHAGLDHLFTVADVWRELPLDTRRPDAVVAGPGRRGTARASTRRWSGSTTWWERIDAWVDAARAQGPDSPDDDGAPPAVRA